MSDKLAEEYTVGLPFDKNKQWAILGHLIEDHQFFVQACSKIQPEWFVDLYAQKIYRAKQDFYKKLNRSPTVEELKNLPEFIREEQKERNQINLCIGLSSTYRTEYGLDALRPELTEWLHSQYFEVDFRKAYQQYTKERDPKTAYATLDKMVANIKTTTFEEDREERFSDYMKDLEKEAVEKENGLTFGLKIFDNLLTPGNKNGSLLRGDTSIVVAPTNIGKTTSMITTVVANVIQKKHVLFITHEGRPTDIKQKIRQCILNRSQNEVLALYHTKEGAMILSRIVKMLDQYLTFLPMNKAGLTVEDVAAVIRKKNEERKLIRMDGYGYDLLVNDYPAKLTTQEARGGNMAKRHIDEIVYGYFVQLGLECGFHVLAAIQTNREGSKVNKGQREDRLLTSEDVLESWGPMTGATNIWTLNRSLRDKTRGRMIVFIDKSRSSETGYAIVCKTNFPNAITHSNELGATFYRGSSTYADVFDQYLDQHLDKEFPEELLLSTG